MKKQPTKEQLDEFERVRTADKEAGGVVRGFKTEWENFVKHHKDWSEKLPLLMPGLTCQLAERERCKAVGKWTPNLKHFKVWINGSWWEAIPKKPKQKMRSCWCGQLGRMTVGSKSFCCSEHRREKLGW